MTPERIDEWVTIFRDVVIVFLATFMLVYETAFAGEVNPYIVGAGLTLAGVPPALRLDGRRKSRSAPTDNGQNQKRVGPDEPLNRLGSDA